MIRGTSLDFCTTLMSLISFGESLALKMLPYENVKAIANFQLEYTSFLHFFHNVGLAFFSNVHYISLTYENGSLKALCRKMLKQSKIKNESSYKYQMTEESRVLKASTDRNYEMLITYYHLNIMDLIYDIIDFMYSLTLTLQRGVVYHRVHLLCFVHAEDR